MKNGKLEACCQQHCTLQFDVALHNELELIFRRGSEWEAGIEHLLILDVSNLWLKHLYHTLKSQEKGEQVLKI